MLCYDLLSFLTQNIRQFETDGASGVILALYSAIFSRYIDKYVLHNIFAVLNID